MTDNISRADFGAATPEHPELLRTSSPARTDDPELETAPEQEKIDSPAKVMRIGTMLKRLLSEVRSLELDSASRQRLREIYEISVSEISLAISPNLRDELSRLASPFEKTEPPSTAELQVAKAQLVGWLEGLIQGMQAVLFAQEMTARRQLDSMRAELLPGRPRPDTRTSDDPTELPHGTYL